MPQQVGGLLECYWLGVPRLTLDQQELSVVSRNAVQLLAYVSLEGPTQRSKMASLFWPDTSEEAARRNLRSVLYRLRESELGELLIAEGSLLRLREPWVSDAQRFFSACEQNDFEAAIALYRGPLLDGLVVGEAGDFEGWLELTRERFARAYREALLVLSEQAQGQGEYRQALELNLKLLEQDDLQERTHAEVMRLHALLGEREAALARFEFCQDLLERELGVEPLPETIELARRIREAPQLEAPPQARPKLALALDAPFVGRSKAIQQIRTSPVALVAVMGEPGVGKTRLIETCAPQALWLRFPEAAQQTPLYALAQAIRQSGPQARSALTQLEPAYFQEVLRLVPELGAGFVQVEGDTNRPEWRARFLEAMSQALRCLVGSGLPGQRPCMVLDDLHWADPMTFEVLDHLLRSGVIAEVQLLATIRAEELEARPNLRSFLATQERQGQLLRLALEPFSAGEVLELIQLLSGSEGGTLFSRRLHQATGGNPLFVVETLRHLFETKVLQVEDEGGWATPYDQSTTDYAELPIPPNVREAVLERVNRLGSAAKRLLEAASLSESPFGLEEVASATALSEWEGLEALEHSVQARLLQPMVSGYAFAHDLAHRSIVEGMSEERRRLVHLKLAQSLSTLQGAPARIANHLEQASRPQQAVPWRIKAAEAATRIYAHQEALEQYAIALHDGAKGEAAFRIHQARLKLLGWSDDRQEQLATLEQMEQLARHLEDSQYRALVWLEKAEYAVHRSEHAQALSLCGQVLQTQPAQAGQSDICSRAHQIMGFALRRLGRLDEATHHLQHALQQSPEQASIKFGIHVELARIALLRNQLAEAQSHFETASEQAIWSGDDVGEISILSELAILNMKQGNPGQAIALFEQALAQARACKMPSLEGRVLRNLGSVYAQTYRFDEALGYLEQGLKFARTPHDPYVEGLILNNMATIHLGRCQLGSAIEKFSLALEVAKEAGLVENHLHRLLSLSEIHLDIGEMAAASRLVQEALELMQHSGLVTLAAWAELLLARIEFMQGHLVQALEQLTKVQATNPSDPEDQFRLHWLLGLSSLAEGKLEAAREWVTHPALPHHQTRLLAVNLQAQTGLGHIEKESLEQAQARLSGAEIGPFDRIDLGRALVAALQKCKREQEALEVLQDLTAHAKAMAASLAAFPQIRQCFAQQHQQFLV